jgi:P27 family predicted phage terminase small subunit
MKPSIRTPKRFSKEAKRLWRALTAEYGIADAGGLAILEAGLEAFDRAREAKALLDADGPVVVDRWGQKKTHPAASIERDARGQWLAALRQLCLDVEPLRPGPGRPPGR